MEVERIVPILTVADLEAGIELYEGVFGMRVVMNHGWIVTLADAAGRQLSLMVRDATAPLNPDVSIFVDDVDHAHRAAVAAAVDIVHPLIDEAWGVRRFFFRDASGNVVNVGMHIPDDAPEART